MPEEKVEGEVEEPVEGTETEAKALTQEELDALVATAAERGKTEALEEYKGIQRVVSQKDQRIRELEAQLAQPSEGSDDALLEVLLQDRKTKATELGEPDPAIARLESELTKRKQKQTQQAQLQWQKQVTQQWEEKFERQIKEAQLDPKDDKLADFQDALEDAKEDGKFSRAERKLNRILSKVKPSEPNTPKGKETMSEEQRIEKLVEEKLRARMEEKGLLKTETGEPSASSLNKDKAYARLAKGEISFEEAKKVGVDFI